MHPAFNPLIQFHKLKFPVGDQPGVTMALWVTARPRRCGIRANTRKSWCATIIKFFYVTEADNPNIHPRT